MNTIARFSKLQSWGFVLGLVLLLLNDFVFKSVFHNWWTGKLSDLAGLFIFPIFLSAFLPKQRLKIYWLIAIGFIIWKSPLSSHFINLWNTIPYLFPIDRVVDYSDYLALGVLPFSYHYFQRGATVQLNLSPALLIIVAGFAFMATSRPTLERVFTYDIRYKIFMPKEELFEKLERINTLPNQSLRSQPEDFRYSKRDTLSFAFKSPQFLEIKFDIYAQKEKVSLFLKYIKITLSKDEKRSFQRMKVVLRKKFEAMVINQLGKPVTRF
ncbi:hypothetical protein BKI52_27815 [marine bacterium AO1-C]|nr:hypothetical protein BKI52_27815 [marine bacterium AO1-C]